MLLPPSVDFASSQFKTHRERWGSKRGTWQARKLAPGGGPDAERFKNEYFQATFSDTISIYLLSLCPDLDYYDLRERYYPLLGALSPGEAVQEFPANGFEFAVLYKRR